MSSDECSKDITLLTAKVAELEAENERLVKVMCRDDVKSQIKTFLVIGLCEFVGLNSCFGQGASFQ